MHLPPCDVCGRPVALKEGAISISFAAIHRYEDDFAAWKERYPGDTHSLGEIAEAPDCVQWVWGHLGCSTSEDDSGYWFSADRISTPEMALGWTLHLLEKRWLRSTEWESLVRRLHDVPRT